MNRTAPTLPHAAGRTQRVGRWVRWPDFRLNGAPEDLRAALTGVEERSATGRGVARRGGTGRTGTALACPAALRDIPAAEAVAFVRRTHRPRAVETWP